MSEKKFKRRIYLISCSAKKYTYPQPTEAYRRYRGPLFENSFKYALFDAKLNGEDEKSIFILSARFGLLSITNRIPYYNETLNDKSEREQIKWAQSVLCDLRSRFNFNETLFIILAGDNYYRHLVSHIPHYKLPLEKLPLGMRVKKLKELNQQLQERFRKQKLKRSENERK